MNNQINDPQFQSRENFDYQSLKNNLYFIYKTCFQNILQQQNIIDINQIKLDEIILHIKSLMNNIIEYQTQIQNYIIKLEADVRHLLKREFQFNILKNSLESKIRAYMNMEEDYQELKEKVHFSEGKFLENDRKDNEISILKKENSSVKKEIIKLEKKYNDLEERLSKDQDIIDELKLKNDKLNNLVSELKKEHFQNMRSNSSINLNIINNNNINPNKNKKNGLFLKQKNTFFNTPKSNYNLESLQSNININQSSNNTKFEYIRKNKNEFTIDNTSNYNTNYNKIFNINTKNMYGTRKNKSRSISMLLDDYDKRENYFWMNNHLSQSIVSWRGFAFENVCFNHIEQIKQALGISGISSKQSAWSKRQDDEEGTQIDMIIERKDNIVNMCEMKFYNKKYSVDKNYHEKLVNRRDLLEEMLPKRMAIHNTLITTEGLNYNEYGNFFDNVIVLDDLFK